MRPGEDGGCDDGDVPASPPSSWGRTLALVVGVGLAVLVIDQVTKATMTGWIGPEADTHRHDVIGTFAGFEYVRNSGVAFGLLQGRQWLVSVLAICVLVGFLLAFWRALPGNRVLQVGVAMVAGGAVGNLLDRTRLGYVVDFIAVGSWPRFNIADSAVTIGLGLLIWVLLTQPDAKQAGDVQNTAEGQQS